MQKSKKKNLILIFGIMVVLFIMQNTFAQEASKKSWTRDYLIFSSGTTPLTDGLNGILGFSNGDHVLSGFFNKEYMNFRYGYRLKKWLLIGPTAEVFKNVPCSGMMVNLNLFNGKIQTTNWVGFLTEIQKQAILILNQLTFYIHIKR